jgi:hypothetical protein
MSSKRYSQWLSPVTVAWVGLGIMLAVNVALVLLRLRNKPFNADELQHLHIAWSIANGEILYLDFWDHHGPLFALLNGALIYLAAAEPTLQILYWSRLMSFAVFGCICWFVWGISRELSLSRLGSGFAVVAFATFFFVQNKVIEMRPDVLQTLFWVGGLYLLIRNQQARNFLYAFLAGALFALAILCNAKAGIGPFFVLLFYLLARWLCRMPWKDIWRDLRSMILGGCAAIAPLLIYFAANGALFEFFYYNYVWNILLNFFWATGDQSAYHDETAGLAVDYLKFFIRDQLPFLLLAITGAILWLFRLRATSVGLVKQKEWLFAITTAGTTLGWALNLFSQYFLIFLPFWSILIAYAMERLHQLLVGKNRLSAAMTSGAIATVATAVMLWHTANNTPFERVKLAKDQRIFTEQFVAMTEREEPVAVIWSLCGGYMFNRNVQYHWAAMPAISSIVEATSGEHPFGQSFIDSMERQQVRYVVGMGEWMTEGLSDEALEYLRDNFEYSHCLWTRRNL